MTASRGGALLEELRVDGLAARLRVALVVEGMLTLPSQ
jgi:hypothetical protein